MFYVSYMLSELRRRRGRTILTALGLAVGVAVVVTVSALSKGLDDAQAQVLKPLTGVGTDLSVSRPLSLSNSGGGPFGNLSPQERQRLRSENRAPHSAPSHPVSWCAGGTSRPPTRSARPSSTSATHGGRESSSAARSRSVARSSP